MLIWSRRGCFLNETDLSNNSISWNKIQSFIKKNGINYPVFHDFGEIARKYSVTGLPCTIIYDRSGKAIKTHIGFESKAFFEEEIKKLL
ncbi:MAG: TlpA disulfide reductase family protein [Candidatus Auribacterota bacterium]|nr:TlpA disulfide reductase family protein [Candidatus Auribacterota bacterium]